MNFIVDVFENLVNLPLFNYVVAGSAFSFAFSLFYKISLGV